MARPCKWVACRYNLFFDQPHTVGAKRRLELLDELPDRSVEGWSDRWVEEWGYAFHSCALDMADDGECGIDEIAMALDMEMGQVRALLGRAAGMMRAAAARELGPSVVPVPEEEEEGND